VRASSAGDAACKENIRPYSLSVIRTRVCTVVPLVCCLTLWADTPGGRQRFVPGPYPAERVTTFTLEPEVRVHINAPDRPASNSVPLLIFYALPNGNTIEQTVGKAMQEGDDWRFNIQHIGAQTRFLRKMLPERSLTVAYLEAASRSWPAWRKKHGNNGIPDIVRRVSEAAACEHEEIVLNGHSGGGSFIFGYINALPEIPGSIVRIAFLDSNYAYDSEAGHPQKLLKWLADKQHYLCVLAYNDAAALLDGKPFVSASGGTWGRSHAMWRDLAREFRFSERKEGDLLKLSALDGRVELLLMENPQRKVLHTVQVERNGFIHSMLFGTAAENKGYKYYGEPVWRGFVQGEPDSP
jgi:hypothetical protein